jgi:hypothetical protein
MPKKPRQKWRVLPDFPNYEINQYGDVREVATQARLKSTEQFQKHYYWLDAGMGIIRIKDRNDLLASIPEFSF